MKYKSTRDTKKKEVSGGQAVAEGLAPDGGLFVPAFIPKIDQAFIKRLCALPYISRAAAVLGLYFSDYSEAELSEICEKAYGGGKFDHPDIAPLVAVGEKVHILELFHGPTCAFKDMALQILPRLLTAALAKTGESRKACILVATSGDTGKAALEGFCDVEDTQIIVFYPDQGVSAVQKLQMITQEGRNVHVCAVKGNFDDAQNGVKAIFSDDACIKRVNEAGMFFSSANSINWGRLAPQIVYYCSAYCDLINNGTIHMGEPVNICVPTGNFGNILAAFIAGRMGIPVNKFICASNANNVLTDFIRTGIYDKNRTFFNTISPSMDILISSNVERLLYWLSGERAEAVAGYMDELKKTGRYALKQREADFLREHFYGTWCGDDKTKDAIKAYYSKYGYLADTHTAVALSALSQYRGETNDATPAIVAATASPYKFCESVLSALRGGSYTASTELLSVLSEATGTKVPASLAALKDKKERFHAVTDKAGMRGYIFGELKI